MDGHVTCLCGQARGKPRDLMLAAWGWAISSTVGKVSARKFIAVIGYSFLHAAFHCSFSIDPIYALARI